VAAWGLDNFGQCDVPAGLTKVSAIAAGAYHTVALIGIASYNAWKNQVFTPIELSNPAISGDAATPAGDGISNLMKYALHLNPKTNGVSGLPVMGIATDAFGVTRLTLAYTRVISATDITYAVEVSGDLNTWRSGPAYTITVSVTNNPDGVTQTVVEKDLTPVTAATHRFIRLKVTRP
jgi:hypothetical protein